MVVVIRPALGFPTFWFGKPKPGWLNRLNASHRKLEIRTAAEREPLRQRGA
jgi:hypothetical protein